MLVENNNHSIPDSFTLKTLGMVDASPEEAFDELTKLAQTVFDAPVALVSIVEVENDRQYFKSQQGLPEPWASRRQTPLTHSFCQHVVANDRPLIVENATENALVCDNLAIRDLNVISYLGVPIYDPDRKPIGSLCVIDGKPRQWTDEQAANLKQLGRCVSDAIRLKAALKTSQMLREEEKVLLTSLERANKELGQFAHVAAHDLQEPLRKIVSFGQLLDEECSHDLNDSGTTYLRYVIDGASRMQQLIRDLLDFSQIKPSVFELTKLSFKAALDEALLNLDGAISESEAIVTVDDLPEIVYANHRQLTQLLQNLVGNAIKYCDGKARIQIGISDESANYVVSIKDNGIGIAPQFHDQIFHIFKRLHGRSKYSGTGIGLAICKRIIDSWHQKIWVESAEGSGTTFYFTVAKTNLKIDNSEQPDGGGEFAQVPALSYQAN